MKERPILFTTEMVKAILDGRKTQTRRVITIKDKYLNIDKILPNKPRGICSCGGIFHFYIGSHEQPLYWIRLYPNWQVGDRLWVREKALYWTGGAGGTSTVIYFDDPEIPQLIEDNNRLLIARETTNILEGTNVVGKWRWKPPIFMPKWASRIWLEITGVRVEKLQDISEEDAVAEGTPINDFLPINTARIAGIDTRYYFSGLWDSINKDYPWESNPWIWVIEFRRIS